MQVLIKKFFIVLYVSFFFTSCLNRDLLKVEKGEDGKQAHTPQISDKTNQTPNTSETTQPEVTPSVPQPGVGEIEPPIDVSLRTEPEPYSRQRPSAGGSPSPSYVPPRTEPEVGSTARQRSGSESHSPPSYAPPNTEIEEDLTTDPIASYVSSKNLKFVFFEGNDKEGFGLYQEITRGPREGDKALWLVHHETSFFHSLFDEPPLLLDNFTEDAKSLIKLIDYDLVYSTDLKKRICQGSSTSNTTRAISLVQNVLFIGKLVFMKPDGTVEVFGKENPNVFMRYFVDASDFSSFEIKSIQEVSRNLYVRLEKTSGGSFERLELKSVKNVFDYEELSQEGNIHLKDFSLEEYIHLLDSIYMQGTFSNCNDQSFYQSVS